MHDKKDNSVNIEAFSIVAIEGSQVEIKQILNTELTEYAKDQFKIKRRRN